MAISVEIHRKLNRFTLDISFRSESRRIGILGASGCGKSMTLKSIAGIETPDEGRITVEDRVMFDSGGKVNLKPQKRNVGYLFQNYALFPTMTVEKNIAACLSSPSRRNFFIISRTRSSFSFRLPVSPAAIFFSTVIVGNSA